MMETIASTLLTTLAGTWFIVSTNFPMWLKGDKTNPEFHYTIERRTKEDVLIDEVRFQKNGKTKSINGIDKQDADNPKAFTWRGKGLLKIAKSNWEVKLMDDNHQWAVIYFSKTLFTPEGVDIISRSKPIDAATLQLIKAKMSADPELKKHVGSLKDL